MTNNAILEKLSEQIGAESDNVRKEQLDNIRNMIRVLSDVVEVGKEAPELLLYFNERSRLDNLDVIKSKLNELLNKHVLAVEHRAVREIDKKKRLGLNLFLSAIAILAIVSIVLTVVNFIYGESFLYGWGGKLASAFGTLDFCLGAISFIWERKEDLKKSEFKIVATESKESGDYEKLAKVVVSKMNTAKWFSKVTDNSVINMSLSEGETNDER